MPVRAPEKLSVARSVAGAIAASGMNAMADPVAEVVWDARVPTLPRPVVVGSVTVGVVAVPVVMIRSSTPVDPNWLRAIVSAAAGVSGDGVVRAPFETDCVT